MSLKRVRELKEKGLDYRDFVCGKACNSYKLYKEDIDLVKKLGCNIYRFGIEWSRLEPIEGEFNEEEFEHYKRVLAYAKRQGLKVMLTIWHWTNPLWLTIEGGWANKRVIKYFNRFVSQAVKELGRNVDYWVVLNEPLIHVSNGYLKAKFPPNKRSPFQAIRVFNNLVEAQKKAYRTIHRRYKNARVGFTKIGTYFEPARKWCPVELLFAHLAHYFYNLLFMKKTERYFDYVGIDYYFHSRIIWRPPFIKNYNRKTNDMGWEIYPKGIYKVLKKFAIFKKPIIIVENGLADADDSKRADFIKEHLKYVHKAMKEGVNVAGYSHWSLLDNFEWAEGWAPKFGLFEMDRETFERKPRPSARVYSKIVKNNQL